VTARVFGLACGVNLPGSGVVEGIHNYLALRPYLSIVLPTTYSLLVCDYMFLLPELFVNLYYFGAGLRASLLRVWGKSQEGRKHTGLLVMERPDAGSAFHVSKIMHSPPKSCPFGVPLPLVHALCGCPEGGKWNYKAERQNGRETVFVFRASCCQVELQMAVFPGRHHILTAHDTTFTEEDWNSDTKRFDFVESEMTRFKVFVSHP
ncbi:hypothetical protein FRC06_007756, partial [Ceratobasidium sp. 370]